MPIAHTFSHRDSQSVANLSAGVFPLVDAGPATKAGLMDVGGALKEQPQVVAELQLETQPRQAGLLDRARAA
eukprot:CAMPEP_0202106896 /NCGR_PEP_ID=MMETSP0965-20130614/13865_1 /ASSEMBLY_ACC=CAM_ASM_000507 /TAXON_ID=4773 /ORGANISM="Schizochytrium aggregatum, Strain ATCC28209" /LENGTH=71 /DNA_ID=CAMNT_0048675965 /DNA_START=60 /DNA_END=271 /DNA_ORIENTATION=-